MFLSMKSWLVTISWLKPALTTTTKTTTDVTKWITNTINNVASIPGPQALSLAGDDDTLWRKLLINLLQRVSVFAQSKGILSIPWLFL